VQGLGVKILVTGLGWPEWSGESTTQVRATAAGACLESFATTHHDDRFARFDFVRNKGDSGLRYQQRTLGCTPRK
jgi:hypothetical protein